MTFSRIILASAMLSVTTDVNRGDVLPMSCSLARRTAAMIDAAITSVEANRSVMRFCSSIAFARSCSSRAIARLIWPIFSPPICNPRELRQQVVGQPSPKNVRRQVPAFLTAARTNGDDPCVRHGLDRRGDVLLATLAEDHKGMNAGGWAVEHGYSVGEYKTNISTIARTGWQVFESVGLMSS